MLHLSLDEETKAAERLSQEPTSNKSPDSSPCCPASQQQAEHSHSFFPMNLRCIVLVTPALALYGYTFRKWSGKYIPFPGKVHHLSLHCLALPWTFVQPRRDFELDSDCQSFQDMLLNLSVSLFTLESLFLPKSPSLHQNRQWFTFTPT